MSKRVWFLTFLVAVSALWWADGYSDPYSSFTPVPAGDVTYGFRSHCGRLQWVQDARRGTARTILSTAPCPGGS